MTNKLIDEIKNILKKFDLSVDSINFKVYNKDIELGTT